MYRVSKCPRENTVITTVFTYWVSIIPYSSLPKISTKSPGVKHNCSALPLMIWKLILIYNSIPWFVKTLPNVWDRGAWWAAVYGIAESQTWLKQLSSNSSSRFLLLNTLANHSSPTFCAPLKVNSYPNCSWELLLRYS